MCHLFQMFQGNALILDGLHALTEETARGLSEMAIPSDEAMAPSLYLQKVRELTPDAAASLRSFGGHMILLDGLKTLDAETARALGSLTSQLAMPLELYRQHQDRLSSVDVPGSDFIQMTTCGGYTTPLRYRSRGTGEENTASLEDVLETQSSHDTAEPAAGSEQKRAATAEKQRVATKEEPAFLDTAEPAAGTEQKRAVSVEVKQAVTKTDGCSIDQVALQSQSLVRYCYESRLEADPAIEGKLVAEVNFHAGSLVDVKIAENRTGDDALGSCIEAKAAGWTFPKPCTEKAVITFLLSPG